MFRYDTPAQGGGAETRGFQMLRRGIPFGPPYHHDVPCHADNTRERGLLFLAYQRSLERQFEVLNSDWMNQSEAPTTGGFDLLVGQNTDSGHHGPKDFRALKPKASTSQSFSVSAQWVIPTGGAYLFAPSLRALQDWGSPP